MKKNIAKKAAAELSLLVFGKRFSTVKSGEIFRSQPSLSEAHRYYMMTNMVIDGQRLAVDLQNGKAKLFTNKHTAVSVVPAIRAAAMKEAKVASEKIGKMAVKSHDT